MHMKNFFPQPLRFVLIVVALALCAALAWRLTGSSPSAPPERQKTVSKTEFHSPAAVSPSATRPGPAVRGEFRSHPPTPTPMRLRHQSLQIGRASFSKRPVRNARRGKAMVNFKKCRRHCAIIEWRFTKILLATMRRLPENFSAKIPAACDISRQTLTSTTRAN